MILEMYELPLSEPGVNDGNNKWRMAKATLRALHFRVDTGFH